MPYLRKYIVLVFGFIFQYCDHFLYFVHWVGCVWVLPVMNWWGGNSTGSSSWLLVDLYSGATSLKIGLVFCSRSCSKAIGQVCINSSFQRVIINYNTYFVTVLFLCLDLWIICKAFNKFLHTIQKCKKYLANSSDLSMQNHCNFDMSVQTKLRRKSYLFDELWCIENLRWKYHSGRLTKALGSVM